MTFVFSPAPGAFFPEDAPAWLSDMHFLREDNAAHSSGVMFASFSWVSSERVMLFSFLRLIKASLPDLR